MRVQDKPGYLIFDLFRGRLKGKRRKKLNKWLDRSPANSALLERLRERDYILPKTQSPSEDELAEHWASVLERMSTLEIGWEPLVVKEDEVLNAILMDRRTPSFWSITILVASFSLLCVLGYLHFVRKSGPIAPEKQETVTITPSYFQPAVNRSFWSFANNPEISSDSTRKTGSQQAGNMQVSDNGDTLRFRFAVNHTLASGSDTLFYKVKTPPGSKHNLELPDGSRARMNAAAQIRIPASFDLMKREVYAEGQNYFSIKKGGTAVGPFIVNVLPPKLLEYLFKEMKYLTVTALGTDFDIRANEKDSSILILLSSGTLKIQSPGNATLYLHAGEAYILDLKGKAHKMPMTRLGVDSSWRADQFLFKFKPATFVLDELGRWYGAKIIYLDKPTALYRFSGSRQKPLDYYLDLMKDEAYFTYKKIKDTIYVSR